MITFEKLRAHNIERAKYFGKAYANGKNHMHEWSPTDYGCALAGEVGELCNLLKKLRRGEDIPKKVIADEIADIQTYLDLTAARVGVGLELALGEKFNEVSERVGYPYSINDEPVEVLEPREEEGPLPFGADRNLIAAAPDLLEALELMIVAWEQLIPNLKHGVVQDYQLVCTTAPIAARAAIDKAKGGG